MGYTHIFNGTLIDGNGGNPVKNTDVVIQDNRIVQVGTNAAPPADAQNVTKIDAQGGYIMPGMIDTHVHLMINLRSSEQMLNTPFSFGFYESVQNMQQTLDAGITTVRDAGGADLGLKQAVESGVVPGPRVQISISVLSITGGHTDFRRNSGIVVNLLPLHPGVPSGICDGVEEVRKKVREVLRAGAEIIKICSTGGVMSPTDHPEFIQFSPEELDVIVQEAAYRRGVKVMAHAQGLEGIKNAVRAGIHSIEHGVYLDDEVIDMMLEKGTFLVPTLLAPVAVMEIAQATGNMPDYAINKAREVVEIHTESISKAYKAGVNIAMGTDAGVMPHGTNLRELGLMCQIGMSPMDAIVNTTKVAAECLGWQDKIGTIEIGKLADVIIAKEDPIKNIRSLENNDNIVLVMKDGAIMKDIR